MASDLFISYSREDDLLGFVTALHDALETDYRTLTGRPISVFLDRADIHLFSDWRDTILAHLQSSRLFLACLSPDYFRSEPCRWEWAEWIKHELARGQYGAGIRQHQPQQRFADDAEESAAADVITALGGITLAVETAAIYLGQHHAQIAPTAYLARLRTDLLAYHEKAARSVGDAVRHGDAEVTATLRPTLDTLTPAARTVLALAALSAPDAVILPWLRAIAGQHHPELIAPPQIGELDAWTETVTRLIALRLLRPTEEPQVLAMHRVLQEVARACHTGPLEEMEKQIHDHAWERALFLWEGWVQHEARWELLPLTATAECWMPQADGIGRRLAGQLSGPLQQLMHFGKMESLLVSALHTLLPEQPGTAQDTAAIVRRLPEFPERGPPRLYSATSRNCCKPPTGWRRPSR